MRDAFFAELATLFARRSDLIFLTGDLGYKLFDPLMAIAPDRVVNFGIREQGMVGFAAGLTMVGWRPVVYSIAPFLTLRTLEQVKVDLCYNHSPVLLVGVGGGLSYGPNGSTHHGVEDLGVMGLLPDMRVFAPGDPGEVRACLHEALGKREPAYLRLGRNGEPLLPTLPGERLPPPDEPRVVRKGERGFLLTTGHLVGEVLAALDSLALRGIRPSLVHLRQLRPFPREFIRRLSETGEPMLACEEHVSGGGLGQAVAEVVAETPGHGPFRMLALPLAFPKVCLDRKALLRWAGLDSVAISLAAAELWQVGA